MRPCDGSNVPITERGDLATHEICWKIYPVLKSTLRKCSLLWRLSNNRVMECVQLAAFQGDGGSGTATETPSGEDLYCTVRVGPLGPSRSHGLWGSVPLGSLGALFSPPQQRNLRPLLRAWGNRSKCPKIRKLNSLCKVGTTKLNEHKLSWPTQLLRPWDTV